MPIGVMLKKQMTKQIRNLYHSKLLSKARWLSKNMRFLFPEGGQFDLKGYKKGLSTNINKFLL